MAIKEQDVVFTTKDENGNTVIQMPITRAANVEDLLKTCLPLSGGTIAGNLKFNGDYSITTQSSSNQFSIFNGSSASQGAGIWLYGNDNNGGGKARIQVYDKANSKYRSLDVLPTGGLTWDGKAVERLSATGSGYIRYASGLQICWGKVDHNKTVSFPVAFSNVPIVVVSHRMGSDSGDPQSSGVYATSTTIFAKSSYSSSILDYYAIGYWA